MLKMELDFKLPFFSGSLQTAVFSELGEMPEESEPLTVLSTSINDRQKLVGRISQQKSDEIQCFTKFYFN